MSDARSLTALSENDYEAIAAAVMETARGRWFMNEFARRNRNADTTQLLGAIDKLQQACGIAAPAAPVAFDLGEAADLIMDLRVDLERVRGSSEDPNSGLAKRMETAAGTVLAAAESIQEAAWGLREAGASDELCDLLDRRTTEIYAATAIVEGSAHQIGKVSDTIAMLDSNLRALATGSKDMRERDAAEAAPSAMLIHGLRDAAPLSDYDDIEIVDIEDHAQVSLTQGSSFTAMTSAHRRPSSVQVIEEDLDFAEIAPVEAPAESSKPAQAASSESDLYLLDAMPADRKLAYFA